MSTVVAFSAFLGFAVAMGFVARAFDRRGVMGFPWNIRSDHEPQRYRFHMAGLWMAVIVAIVSIIAIGWMQLIGG